MHRIVHAVLTLEQHLRAVVSTPQSYRPDRCPHCGFGNLWGHGFYDRKADHSSHAELNPVPVPRFRCRACNRTCSRLPLCICPRRWYAWALQQLVLSLMLFGLSLRCTAAVTGLSRHTVRRWWAWLRECTQDFAFLLRSRFPELGRTGDTASFWQTCFRLMSLDKAMAWLDRDGLSVP
jgi:transposase-like protein